MLSEVRASHTGTARVGHYTSWLASDTVVILLFHGVVERHRYAVRNYIRKHLARDEFISVLQGMLAEGRPVPMEDFMAASRGEGNLPERAFVVTFDDGFANNYEIGAPILADLEVPATFYVTTDFLSNNKSAAVDKIEEAVEQKSAAEIDLPQYNLQSSWRTADERIRFMEQVRQAIYQDKSVVAEDLASEIRQELGVGEFRPDNELDNKMTWEQVKELDQHRLFSIGGHSHSHAILSYLSDQKLAAEVDTSLALLQRHLGRRVDQYAYPQGLDFCYSDKVIAALKGRGITSCPTAEVGVNRVGDDPFRLKRVMVT